MIYLLTNEYRLFFQIVYAAFTSADPSTKNPAAAFVPMLFHLCHPLITQLLAAT